MFQLVVVQNGQYGVARFENKKEVLGKFETREQALAEAEGKFRMLEIMQSPTDKLEGTPADFTNTVEGDGHANFTDHYFIEEV